MDPMTYAPGKLLHAIVDGTDAVVYLTLRCEGKGADRKDHWWRYCPPSNELVPYGCKVEPGEYVETKTIAHAKDYRKG